MKIDKITPEKVEKNPEAAREKEKQKRKEIGTMLTFFIGISFVLWWMFFPDSLKGFGIAAYDFLNNTINHIKAIK